MLVSQAVWTPCNSLIWVTRPTTCPCDQPVCPLKWPHKSVCQAVC
ncbi:Isoleucine--tRNA ligase, mitochondrial [Gossypium arboreum]|uniref:Isoleucine--tRNA ligase, mitochondrial n=1 Tax=Gossypium arboreum TaxID=29729 RepID=A0A0B0N2K0_GOSAR|nr:Isoleucine--tRNA ligase, mitochondrial [Gossypium arboreum]